VMVVAIFGRCIHRVCKPVEGFEASSEVVSHQKGLQAAIQRQMGVNYGRPLPGLLLRMSKR
jgi:hypothetical protein